MKQYLRHLPPVHQLQNHETFQTLLQQYQIEKKRLTQFVQEALEDVREQILESKFEVEEISELNMIKLIFKEVEKNIQKFQKYRLHKVINGTGTILHTNLGRARLSQKAIQQVVNIAQNYSNLEFETKEGKRGSRHNIIEDLIKEVTGAEAAMVVNNNAAAVYLILRALAKNKEVIVSRGQLVEIGGSFRVSAIMEESEANLVEVGTTNKTHLYDYEHAVNEETAMIMKVHTSNFKTVGFTESVDTKELVKLKNKFEDLYLYEDLGSGALYDFRKHNIGEEPVVKEVIESGVDLVSFSGDKLLGGPQAGIIAGRKEVINRLKRHQLARVLRVDKMTFAALEATLKDYLLGESQLKNIPTVRDILESMDTIKHRATTFINEVKLRTDMYTIALSESTSTIGGGTMPGVELPTYVVEISHLSLSSSELSQKLRLNDPCIVPRVKDEKVLIDFRTVSNEELRDVIQAFLTIN